MVAYPNENCLYDVIAAPRVVAKHQVVHLGVAHRARAIVIKRQWVDGGNESGLEAVIPGVA